MPTLLNSAFLLFLIKVAASFCPHESVPEWMGLNISTLKIEYQFKNESVYLDQSRHECITWIPFKYDQDAAGDLFQQADMMCKNLHETSQLIDTVPGLIGVGGKEQELMRQIYVGPRYQRAVAYDFNKRMAVFALQTLKSILPGHENVHSIEAAELPSSTNETNVAKMLQPPICDLILFDPNVTDKSSSRKVHQVSCQSPPDGIEQFVATCVGEYKDMRDAAVGKHQCSPGKGGRFCGHDQRYVLCKEKVCQYGICDIVGGKAECLCVQGTTGEQCDKLEYDPCEGVTCSGRGICYTKGLDFGCNCKGDNIEGAFCEIVINGHLSVRPSFLRTLISLLFLNALIYVLVSSYKY